MVDFSDKEDRRPNSDRPDSLELFRESLTRFPVEADATLIKMPPWSFLHMFRSFASPHGNVYIPFSSASDLDGVRYGGLSLPGISSGIIKISPLGEHEFLAGTVSLDLPDCVTAQRVSPWTMIPEGSGYVINLDNNAILECPPMEYPVHFTPIIEGTPKYSGAFVDFLKKRVGIVNEQGGKEESSLLPFDHDQIVGVLGCSVIRGECFIALKLADPSKVGLYNLTRGEVVPVSLATDIYRINWGGEGPYFKDGHLVVPIELANPFYFESLELFLRTGFLCVDLFDRGKTKIALNPDQLDYLENGQDVSREISYSKNRSLFENAFGGIQPFSELCHNSFYLVEGENEERYHLTRVDPSGIYRVQSGVPALTHIFHNLTPYAGNRLFCAIGGSSVYILNNRDDLRMGR